MKDFRKKSLYSKEQGLYSAFLERKLETKSEYDRTGKFMVGDEDEDEVMAITSGNQMWGDMESTDWGSDSFSFDSGGSMFGSSNSGSDEHSKSLPDDRYTRYNGEGEQFANALRLGALYTFKGLIHHGVEQKKDWENIFKYWTNISLGLGGVALLGMAGLTTNLVHPAIGLLAMGTGVLADYYNAKWNGVGFLNKYCKVEQAAETEGETSSESESGLGSLGDFGGSGGDFDFGSDFGSDFGLGGGSDDDFGFGSDDIDFSMDDFNEDSSSMESGSGFSFGGLGKQKGLGRGSDDFEEEDEDYEESESNSEIERLFPSSPISVASDEDFDQTLLKVFRDGNKNKGKDLHYRSDIVKSFAPYMVSNDATFASWKDVKEKSMEYNNIAFTIYKALVDIDNKFDIKSGKDKEKLTIVSMMKTPLIYKVEVKLPVYLKPDRVIPATLKFENVLKNSAEDTEVACLISAYDDVIVIKFIRFEAKGLISLGDILRYQSAEVGSEPVIKGFIKDKGIPILAGLRDNEFPYMFDLEGNTSGNIVGGSGSGKSWLTFLFMMNMLISNSPDDLQFIILDAKNAPIWQQFARTPHVLGYHADITKYIEFLNEVSAEQQRRQQALSDLEIEDWKTLREDLRKQEKWDELKKYPTLIVVLDEITFTMASFANYDDKKETYNTVKNLLGSLSAVVRSAGIRLITIGQRSIDSSIPKTLMANASMKFGMKMNAQSDFNIMFDKKDVEKCRKPTGSGEGLMLVEGSTKIEYIKTLTPGGASQSQIQKLIRVVGLDWTRRTIGNGVDYTKVTSTMSSTISICFNRDKFYKMSLHDLENGYILNSRDRLEAYAVNIEPGKPADLNNHFGVSPEDSFFAPKDVTPKKPKEPEFSSLDFGMGMEMEGSEEEESFDIDFSSMFADKPIESFGSSNFEEDEESDWDDEDNTERVPLTVNYSEDSEFDTDDFEGFDAFNDFSFSDDAGEDLAGFDYHADSTDFGFDSDSNSLFNETDSRTLANTGFSPEIETVPEPSMPAFDDVFAFEGDEDEDDFSDFESVDFEFESDTDVEEETGPYLEPESLFEGFDFSSIESDPIITENLEDAYEFEYEEISFADFAWDDDEEDYAYGDEDFEDEEFVTGTVQEEPELLGSIFDSFFKGEKTGDESIDSVVAFDPYEDEEQEEFTLLAKNILNEAHATVPKSVPTVNTITETVNQATNEPIMDYIDGDDEDDFDDLYGDDDLEDSFVSDPTFSFDNSEDFGFGFDTESDINLSFDDSEEVVNQVPKSVSVIENKEYQKSEQIEKERQEFQEYQQAEFEKIKLVKEQLEKERLAQEQRQRELDRLEKEKLAEAKKIREQVKQVPNPTPAPKPMVKTHEPIPTAATTQIALDRYILNNGQQRDMFSRYCSKDEIKRLYSPRQIKLAIQNGSIFEVKDSYVASF